MWNGPSVPTSYCCCEAPEENQQGHLVDITISRWNKRGKILWLFWHCARWNKTRKKGKSVLCIPFVYAAALRCDVLHMAGSGTPPWNLLRWLREHATKHGRTILTLKCALFFCSAKNETCKQVSQPHQWAFLFLSPGTTVAQTCESVQQLRQSLKLQTPPMTGIDLKIETFGLW